MSESELREYRYLWLPLSLALLASINVYWYLSDLATYDTAIVATRSISPGMVISPHMVTSEKVHSTALHPQAFGSLEEVVGLISLAPVVPGEQLLVIKTSADPSYRGLSAQIGGGYRGIYVPAAGQRGLLGALMPGEKVDILHVDNDWRSDFSETTSVVREVLVLDVRDERGTRYVGSGDSLPAGVILLVSPEEAKAIAHSQTTGSLFLTIAPAERR